MTATHKRILRNLIYPQRRSWRYYTALQGVWGVKSKCFALYILDLEKLYQIQTHFGTWKKYSSEASQKIRQKIDGRPPINPRVIYAPSSSKIEYLLITRACFQPKRHFGRQVLFLVIWHQDRGLLCANPVQRIYDFYKCFFFSLLEKVSRYMCVAEVLDQDSISPFVHL